MNADIVNELHDRDKSPAEYVKSKCVDCGQGMWRRKSVAVPMGDMTKPGHGAGIMFSMLAFNFAYCGPCQADFREKLEKSMNPTQKEILDAEKQGKLENRRSIFRPT